MTTSPLAPGPGTPPRSSGVVPPHPVRWHGRLAARLIWGVIHGVDLTLRYQLVNPSGSLSAAAKTPVIFCIWHNRLALCLRLYHRYLQRQAPARRMAAMVSASRDGALLARVLDHFGVQPVRGSTSRRGPQAMLELTTWAERGYDLAITPDGPRGPAYVVQEGAIAAAQLTGLPIMPVAYDLTWKVRLKSWDRFQVPLPWSRCTARLGALIEVPRELSAEGREEFRQRLQRDLLELTFD